MSRRAGVYGAREHEAEAAWVRAARVFLSARTGEPSNYAGRSLRAGHVRASGARVRTPVWGALVRRAEAAGVSAPAAIGCLLSWWPHSSLPEPLQAVSPENLSILHDRIARRRPAIARAYESETILLRTQVASRALAVPDPAEARRRAIADPGHDLSPLMRFAVACRYGEADLAALWHERAFEQYRHDAQAYRELWGAVLTPAVLTTLEGPRRA
jgi:hypothetical protein